MVTKLRKRLLKVQFMYGFALGVEIVIATVSLIVLFKYHNSLGLTGFIFSLLLCIITCIAHATYTAFTKDILKNIESGKGDFIP